MRTGFEKIGRVESAVIWDWCETFSKTVVCKNARKERYPAFQQNNLWDDNNTRSAGVIATEYKVGNIGKISGMSPLETTQSETTRRIEQLPEDKMGNEIAEKFSHWYDESQLGIVISGIPNLGGPIDKLLSGRAQATAKRRIKEMFTYLQQEMERVDDSKVDLAFLDTEEFEDLIIGTMRAAAQTRQKEKLHLFAQILAGAVQVQDRDGHDPEDYLDILAELKPQDLELLHRLYDQQKDFPPYDFRDWVTHHVEQSARKNPYTQLENFDYFGFSPEDRAHLFLRLLKTGLVMEAFNTPGVFVVTETLKKIVRYIRDGPDRLSP